MTRSADRTMANVDNANTFYLTNVVPQQADLNQGVWAQFENALGDSAEAGRAVYIITGPLYSRSHALTFLKNEGKVAIPDSTWKVALIGPRNGGVPFTRGDVQSWDDLAGLTVLAVNMPNVAGVRNDPWQKYLTTVDKIEPSTGYDFLSLLQTSLPRRARSRRPAARRQLLDERHRERGLVAHIRRIGEHRPRPRTHRPRTHRGAYLHLALQRRRQASGKVAYHTFHDNGSFTATLTVADAFGWEKSSAQNVAVANVTPVVTLRRDDTDLDSLG